MRNKIFNTPFENMLRILLLTETVNKPMNIDRMAALDFICIFGKKCRVLDKNLHGDNEFGFSEFTTKRERITEAAKLAVKNNFLMVENTKDGFAYSINARGKQVNKGLQSPYARAYVIGAKIVNSRFSAYSDEEILEYISDLSTKAKEG
ncbi:MAG: hypothetical protein J6A79_05030 [Clostridia bacterium]|jgi:hypothetical protein|nr:hypothetical protein [Clostridia bacterium]MBQ1368519.1 hypothetical protein [Bacillota bacterium]